MLKQEDWRYDRVPEIMDGMNIADFIDEDILRRLEELEREEEAASDVMEEDVEALTEEQLGALKAIRKKKDESIVEGRMKPSNPIPRSKRPTQLGALESHLEGMGIKMGDETRQRMRSQSRTRKRGLSTHSDMEDEEEGPERKKMTRSESRARSMSVVSVRKGEGFKDVDVSIRISSLFGSLVLII